MVSVPKWNRGGSSFCSFWFLFARAWRVSALFFFFGGGERCFGGSAWTRGSLFPILGQAQGLDEGRCGMVFRVSCTKGRRYLLSRARCAPDFLEWAPFAGGGFGGNQDSRGTRPGTKTTQAVISSFVSTTVRCENACSLLANKKSGGLQFEWICFFFFIFLNSPTAESFGVSTQIGFGVVRGGPEVRFHEGSTRVPPDF